MSYKLITSDFPTNVHNVLENFLFSKTRKTGDKIQKE